MRRSSKPLPKDANKLAHHIVHFSTTEEEVQIMEKSEISKYLSQIGRKGGLKGGKARAEKLTREERSNIAKKAAQTRWGKK